jgi:hypothetical protein
MEGCVLMRLVVFDDEEDKGRLWSEQLAEFLPGWEVTCRDPAGLERDLEELEARRRAFARQTAHPASETAFDFADVLVVDFNLFELDRTSVLSGEDVAYLARCYSDCGYIVGVNQDHTRRWYDLDMVGHPNAFTDFSVGEAHLFSPELWRPGVERSAFSPWHWPCIPVAAQALMRCFERADAEHGLFGMLDISPERRHLLPRTVLGRVQPPKREQPEYEITIQDVVASSALGLRLDDRPSDEHVPRIAAARIRKWLNGEVLARQDILVDGPHLLRRMPGLAGDADVWQSPFAPDGSSPVLEKPAVLEYYAYCGTDWLDRPAWWWPPLASDGAAGSLRAFEGFEHGGLVFCEDTSRFVARENAHPFVNRLGGPFSQRWVEIPTSSDGVRPADYEPALALAR